MEPIARIPPEDVPGGDISGLPRYPGSVRVEYERGQRDDLKVVRVTYLTRDGLDAIRDFYRGIFRAEKWKMANVEFSEDRWTFLVVHGEREAHVRIEPHNRDVTKAGIELTEPLPQKETPQKPEAGLAPQEPVPPQPATPTTAPASPTLDYYDDGGEDWDDSGDDGGGDD
jgi:hypothetical protein